MNSGIYEIKCATCKLYFGQTNRSLKHRYQKRVRYIKQNGAQSAYTIHILNTKYEYGPINNTMCSLNQVVGGVLRRVSRRGRQYMWGTIRLFVMTIKYSHTQYLLTS